MPRELRKRKSHIPRALREQVWIQYVGCQFEKKCLISWCKNKMTVFDFHVGHDIPESRGGTNDIINLRPICARCNLSMSNQYTIKEWNKIGTPTTTTESIKKPWWMCCSF